MMNDSQGKMADAAFICTPDRLHYEPAIRALELNYDLVLEKPITPFLNQCQEIAQLAKEKGRLVQICHVLRFTDFWRLVKNIIDSGRIGKVIHYDHSENVSFWHMGHSFVRGWYGIKDKSSPMILAKCCHDLDLMHWILGQNPICVQSTGSLTNYRPEMAPPGVPERCTDGCPVEKECPWYAPRLYCQGEPLVRIALHAPSRSLIMGSNIALHHQKFLKFMGLFVPQAKNVGDWKEFPTTAITTDLSMAGKMKALREGQFGKCIYKAGNDVVDHQISTFTFPDGVTGTLTMHGLSEFEGRELRVFGSKGALRGYFRYSGEHIEVTDFRYSKTEVLYNAGMSFEGHGGGDFKLMDAFTSVMLGEKTPEQAGTTDIASAMESHYMAFAAEDARINGQTLQMGDYR
jgi:predicted dehydrogenase